MEGLEARDECNDLGITTYITVPITDAKYVITSSRFRYGAIDRLEWKWVTRAPSPSFVSFGGDATSAKSATMSLNV